MARREGGASPVDLDIPETFHRLKRTLLLFSVALMVIALGTPEETYAMNAAVTSITITTLAAKWMLWAAATYYLVGFALEVRLLLRANTEAMKGAGVAGLVNATGGATKWLGEAEALLARLTLLEGADLSENSPVRMLNPAGSANTLDQQIASLQREVARLRDLMEREYPKLTLLAFNIKVERWLYFYIFEIAAPVLVYAIALAATLGLFDASLVQYGLVKDGLVKAPS